MSRNTDNKAITLDGGKSWRLIAQGSAPGYRSCVQYLGDHSPDQIIAVGIPGVSTSDDGGKNWEQLSNQSFYTVRKAGNVLWFGGGNRMSRLAM